MTTIAEWLAAQESAAREKTMHTDTGNATWHLAQAKAYEAAHAYAVARPDASAPPAPTPEAGIDLAKLSDPEAVHVNMLRGVIARPSVEQIIHLYGKDALLAALAPPPSEDLAGQGEPTPEQLREYGYAPGGPRGRCFDCGKQVGVLEGMHKDAWRCEECATAAWREATIAGAAGAIEERPLDARGIVGILKASMELQWDDHRGPFISGYNDAAMKISLAIERQAQSAMNQPEITEIRDCLARIIFNEMIAPVQKSGWNDAIRATTGSSNADEVARARAVASEILHALASQFDQDQPYGGPGIRDPLVEIVRKPGKEPCGECHIQPGETCDVCGAVAPAPDLAGQGEPLAVWIRRAIMANLKGEADGVDEAVAVIVSNLEALAPDLVIQGEPVAWRVGSHYNIHVYDGDRPVATFHSAEDASRAVSAVNAAPAPSQPADRAEANRLFEAIKDALYAADVLYGHPAHARLKELRALALRDAPRDGGDGARHEVSREDIDWLAREAIRTNSRTLARIAAALLVDGL